MLKRMICSLVLSSAVLSLHGCGYLAAAGAGAAVGEAVEDDDN
ncbi:MAG: hypothetical protein C0P79_001620 [Gammaproteobacteria bacterium]